MFFCFFKQRTAYEMRISDWSSDVCSSDLGRVGDSLVVRRGTLGVSGRLGRSLGLDGLLVGDELARLGGGLGEVGDLLGLGGGLGGGTLHEQLTLPLGERPSDLAGLTGGLVTLAEPLGGGVGDDAGEQAHREARTVYAGNQD